MNPQLRRMALDLQTFVTDPIYAPFLAKVNHQITRLYTVLPSPATPPRLRCPSLHPPAMCCRPCKRAAASPTPPCSPAAASTWRRVDWAGSRHHYVIVIVPLMSSLRGWGSTRLIH